MTFSPTPEQSHALNLFGTGESLAIEAGAGSGKTTTLKLLAESVPNRTGQYVAFNKAIVTDSAAKFPGTVNCSTAHSLAFRAVGKRFSHRLNAPRMRSFELARRLGVDPITITTDFGKKVLQPSYLASLVMRSVTLFCQSADLVPGESHVPYIDGIDLPTGDGRRTFANNREVRSHLRRAIAKAWADLSDPNGTLPYKHEHYLKTWQLSGPRIAKDFILFDEAQDASPVLLAAVMEQAQYGTQLVLVGDSQQAIYGFTGAIDALSTVDVKHRAMLSQSFRFGESIADTANRVLCMIPDAVLRIAGSEDIASIVGPVPSPDAVLCRTNATAVERVLKEQTAGRRPHLVGGGDDVRRFAEAAADLMDEKGTSHPDLACFDTWGEVQTYVEQDPQGSELRLLVRLVDDFGVDTIKRALGQMPREDAADVVVSTAHKSKGREWASVQLSGDFCPPPKDTPDDVKYVPDHSELRLLYVAVTRARLELDETAVELFNAQRVRDAADDAIRAAAESSPVPSGN